MSHDCDCSDCQETDSRWAYARRIKRAKAEDCPRGVHMEEFWTSNPKPDESQFRCAACNIWLYDSDIKGKCPHCGGIGAHFCTQKPKPQAKEFNYFQTAAESAQEIQAIAEATRAMAPVCPTHKRYQAKRKPRVPCEGCWRRWLFLNP